MTDPDSRLFKKAKGHEATLTYLIGGDKGYDTHGFVDALRALESTPHIAQKRNSRTLDGRTTRHPGYPISQRARKRIEEVFGWTGAGVSLGAAFGATLPFAVITIVLMRLMLRSRTGMPQAGVEKLMRDVGKMTEAIDGGAGAQPGRGMVRVHGELWRAASTGAIPEGTPVRVVGVDGLTLYVEPVE